jgi:hypothetical protein
VLGLPDTLVKEVQWKLQAQTKRLGKIFGLMFPTFFGCRSTSELSRVRVWDKNLPGRMLGAWPKRKWVTHVPRLGQALLETLWRHVEDKSPATRSRWQWTWVSDDSVFKTYGPRLGLVGTWWSGQAHRGRQGIDGVLLGLGLGNGKLVIPVDFTIRRPDPVGPGRPCHDKLTWRQIMVARTWVTLQRRRLSRPAPLIVAASWFGDPKLMAQVALQQHGTLLVEGKGRSVFHLPDGRRVTGQDLRTWPDWPWRDGLWLPGIRSARVTATSPTYGPVTGVIVEAASEERYYLLCHATPLTALRLIQAWKRRSWIEHHFRTLMHLLATEACQLQGEDAYYGHLVLRLLAGWVVLSTARSLYKGRVTLEAMGFSLKHYWRFLDAERLE